MIRPRRSEDLDDCVALLGEVYRGDRYPVRWPRDPARWLVGRDGLAAWVSESDGTVDGHVSLHGTDESRARAQWLRALAVPAERIAVVSRFFVADGSRGRGVGRALMAAAEDHAAERDLRLALDVADHNLDAIAFYERCGWRRVGTATLTLDVGTFPLVVYVLPERR
jgi:GNAT superfamily N-acetyltransferase